MEQSNYEWVPHPPTKSQRILAALWLIPMMLFFANYLGDWQLLGGYDTVVFGGFFLASIIFLQRMPSARLREGASRPVRHWIIVAAIVAISLVGVFAKNQGWY